MRLRGAWGGLRGTGVRVTKAMVESLKVQFGLDGWTITVRKKRGSNGDALGETVTQPRFKRATITLYPDKIRAEKSVFPDESQKKVLRHEFGEIWMSQFEVMLPDSVVESEAYIKFADAAADELARIIL